MNWISNIAITMAAFLTMEGVAWFTHKFVMHGFLWSLHRDHHKKDSYGFFERNDFFFLVFAIPGIACLFSGMNYEIQSLFFIGAGITLYGAAYFFVHDIFIHQRIKWLSKTDNNYFRAIRRAHKMHHKHLEKHDGECFGMLWVPLRYFREAKSGNS